MIAANELTSGGKISGGEEAERCHSKGIQSDKSLCCSYGYAMKSSTSITVMVSLLFLVMEYQVGSSWDWVQCKSESECMYQGCGNRPCTCSQPGPLCVNGKWVGTYQGLNGVSTCLAGVWKPICDTGNGQVPIEVCMNWFPQSSTNNAFQTCPDPPSCPTGTYSDDGKNGAGDKACRKCPVNSFPEDTEGSKRCICNAGYEGPTCAACDEGKYKEPSEFPSFFSKCLDCPISAGSSVKGSTSKTSFSCNAGYTKQDCQYCTSGFQCTGCEKGKYKDSRGNGPCTSCPINTDTVSWWANTDVSACTPVIKPKCAPNTYSSDCTPTTAGSQSQGVSKTLIVVGLLVGTVFTS